MYTAALFINVKTLKQPRNSSTGEWINKPWTLSKTDNGILFSNKKK